MNAITGMTADPNATLIKDVYAAFGRGDVPFILGRLAPGARWDFNVGDSNVPWHRPAEGPEEVQGFLGAFVDNVALEQFDPRQFIASGDDVVAHIHIAYVIKRSGKRVEQDQLHWWTVKDGRIARLRHFEDTAQVVGAWQA